MIKKDCEVTKMKCIIMETFSGIVRVISISREDSEDIEALLTGRYDYNLSEIHYMVVEEFELKLD